MFLVLLLYLFCASSFTIAKAVLLYAAPIFFVGARMTIAGSLIIVGMLATRYSLYIRRSDLLLFMVVTFFHIYLAYILDVWSLQYISSCTSAFLFNLSPFITALIAYIFLKEKLTIKKWIGLLIGFFGISIGLHQSYCQALTIDYIPIIALLGAITSSCAGWVLMKRLLERGYSPWHINGVAMFGGGIAALATSYVAEQWWLQNPIYQLQPFLVLTLVIIVVCNIVFYNLYGYLLRHYSATFLSFAGFTCPLFAALLGFIFLREIPEFSLVIAAVIVAIGLYIFYQDEL